MRIVDRIRAKDWMSGLGLVVGKGAVGLVDTTDG